MAEPFRPCACCAPEFERIAARLRELEAHFVTIVEPVVTTPSARVVHLLANGSFLCGIGLPLPERHEWVSFFDPRQRMLATCLPCTRAAR